MLHSINNTCSDLVYITSFQIMTTMSVAAILPRSEYNCCQSRYNYAIHEGIYNFLASCK